MKKLSISLVIALICILMFSCDEKSVISPQNEDCKITGISSHSGASSSTVIVYGKNLSKDSKLIVKFGSQNAEILSRTDDSIVVKVPNIPEGLYDFHAINKARKELFITKFDLQKDNLNIDFAQFKNYEFSLRGFNLKFNTHHILKDIFTNEGDWTDISSSYSKMYINNYKLEFLSIVKGFYKWSENFSTQGKGVKNSISMSFNEFNGKIKSLHADFYESSYSSNEYSRNDKHSNLTLELEDISFNFNNNESTLTILLNKDEIIAKMKKIDIGWFSSYDEWQGHRTYSDYNTTLLEILGINDNATIEIKFTK